MSGKLKITVKVETQGIKIEVPSEFDLKSEGIPANTIAEYAEKYVEKIAAEFEHEDDRLSPQGDLCFGDGGLPGAADAEVGTRSSAKKSVKKAGQ